MNTRIASLSLALLGGMATLAMPTGAHAGNVGFYDACPYAGFETGDPAGVIAAAGHTKVDLVALDAASLNGLVAVYIVDCYNYPLFWADSSPDLNTAVQNGMGLVFESMGYSSVPNDPTAGVISTTLPGAPTFSSFAAIAFPEGYDVVVPATSPIANGPGGMVTATSLDRATTTFNTANLTHWYPRNTLPSGAVPFLTTPNPDHVAAFGYNAGAGRVAFTDSQFSLFHPGAVGYGNGEPFAAGGLVYLTNLIAWAAEGGPVTTCASEGYTGTQLTWCQNICENGLTGQKLDTWIHRWINRYRDLPYCAREDAPPPPPPPQET